MAKPGKADETTPILPYAQISSGGEAATEDGTERVEANSSIVSRLYAFHQVFEKSPLLSLQIHLPTVFGVCQTLVFRRRFRVLHRRDRLRERRTWHRMPAERMRNLLQKCSVVWGEFSAHWSPRQGFLLQQTVVGSIANCDWSRKILETHVELPPVSDFNQTIRRMNCSCENARRPEQACSRYVSRRREFGLTVPLAPSSPKNG